MLYVFIVVVQTTSQVSVSTDLMITERNQGQHLGTSENAEQVTQVIMTLFFNRIRETVTKLGLMKG